MQFLQTFFHLNETVVRFQRGTVYGSGKLFIVVDLFQASERRAFLEVNVSGRSVKCAPDNGKEGSLAGSVDPDHPDFRALVDRKRHVRKDLFDADRVFNIIACQNAHQEFSVQNRVFAFGDDLPISFIL